MMEPDMEQFTIVDLNKILNELFGVNNISIDTNTTVEDLMLDSLDMVELVMTLEEELGIEIPDDDCEHWFGSTTMGSILHVIEGYLK